MTKAFSAIIATALVALSAPADAAPTIQIFTSAQIAGPTSPRMVAGQVTFAATDTYATGGFAITPQQIGLNNGIVYGVVSQINGQFTVAPSNVSGSYVLKITSAISGANNIPATATSATITIPASLANSPFNAQSNVICQLNDAATSGGGTGTWGTTTANSTCKYVSATSFTIVSTAAAPTGGGNFTYFLPNNFTEIPAGTSLANITIPFLFFGN